MKTFQEFISLAERYYGPDERLPGSDKSPVEKATEKSRRRTKTIGSESPENQERWGRQYDLTQTKVKHGADNPKVNDRVSHKDKDDLKIYSNDDSTDIYHKPSGVYYTIYKSEDSPYSRTIEWNHDHGNRGNLSRQQRMKITSDAKKVWNQHVAHRLPYGSIVHNAPSASYDSRGREKPVNRRANIYQRSGFGPLDDEGDQFAKVDREPSLRQRAKGKKRLKPLNPTWTKTDLEWGKDDDNYNEWED